MFHRTLRQNIAFGRLDADDAEIRKAAEAANAAEFVEGLPQGYDTRVGERGVKPRVDSASGSPLPARCRAARRSWCSTEATSSLDSESESLIQEALGALMPDRTAIVIAHRLSTLQAMDRLVVLADGEIREDGSHAQLLAAGSAYASLWQQQSGGFLGVPA